MLPVGIIGVYRTRDDVWFRSSKRRRSDHDARRERRRAQGRLAVFRLFQCDRHLDSQRDSRRQLVLLSFNVGGRNFVIWPRKSESNEFSQGPSTLIAVSGERQYPRLRRPDAS